MTKDEALKMAIREFEVLSSFPQYDFDYVYLIKELKACKEVLEQPAQEPVAWMNDIAFSMDKELLGTRSRIVPLYTHPAPSWQGLSDDELSELLVSKGETSIKYLSFARAIEQALKEKNT